MSMYARVSTVMAAPGMAARAREVIEGQVIPGVQSEPGYLGLIALVADDTGKSFVISLWESEAAMKASDERARAVRAGSVAAVNAGAPVVDHMEVVVASRVTVG